MYAVTPRFLSAIRRPHTVVTKASHKNLVTGVVTQLSIEDGTVTDDATAQVRRSLSMTVPPSEATWQALDTVGGEITVTQSIRYVDGNVETIPMGVFIVDHDDIGYGPGDTISITTAPDRYGKILKNTLPPTQRAAVSSNAAWAEVKRLVEGAWSGTYPFPGWASLDTSATTPVGPLLWANGDRGAAIQSICDANAIEVLFDRNGLGVLRKVPVLTNATPAVWTVVAADQGVLVSASRTRDRTGLRNVIVVSTTATNVVFPPVVVANTDPTDPLSTAGPLGYMAEDYSLATLQNSAQAQAAGRVRLSKTLGVAKQLSLQAVGNPALDSTDPLTVVLPPVSRGNPRPVELHAIDVVTHPFAPTGTQALTTRSLVADQSKA